MAFIDRWIVVPAVASAVFTTVAIAPPTGRPGAGLRVETLGPRQAGRPLLVRVAVDPNGGPGSGIDAPRTAALRVRDASGVVAAGDATAPDGAAFAYGAVTPRGAGPYTLEVEAARLAAAATLPARAGCEGTACVPPPPEVASIPHGVDLAIEGGQMVPDVPVTMIIRAPDEAGATVNATGDAPGVEFRPADVTLDACGTAVLEARVSGMDGSLTLRVGGAAGRVIRRRLDLAPGGVAVRAAAGGIEVASAAGGQTTYVLSGDASGPNSWSALRLPASETEHARAVAALPSGSAWALASLAPSLAPAAGLWLVAPSNVGCTSTEASSRWLRARWPLPTWGQPQLVYDGAAMARADLDGRRGRVRTASLGLAGLSVSVLVALVLRAGLRRDPTALREVASPRQRIGIALASAATLVVGALVLLSAFLLRV